MTETCPACGQPVSGDPLLATLRRLRLSVGLTQGEVGQMLMPPRSHAAVSDIERGETVLTVPLLRQLAAIYRTTTVDVLLATDG
jgi:transcriptional regulator with XRE-family HTH domain